MAGRRNPHNRASARFAGLFVVSTQSGGGKDGPRGSGSRHPGGGICTASSQTPEVAGVAESPGLLRCWIEQNESAAVVYARHRERPRLADDGRGLAAAGG